MVGIARFAKKAGNSLGNNPAAATDQLDNPTTSSTPNGLEASPSSPSKDATNIFNGRVYGGEFQDGGSDGFGNYIGTMNHQGGYRDEFDLGGLDSFHQEGAPSADDGEFFGGTFPSDSIEDIDMSYGVDMAGDTATLGENQDERSMQAATSSRGLSRFAMTQEAAETDGQNDKSSRFSKDPQESSGTSTRQNSKSDTTMNKRNNMYATTGLSRISQEPVSIQKQQGGVATSVEASLQEQCIIMSDHPSELKQRQQVSWGQAGANQTSREVSSARDKVSNISMGGYSLDGYQQLGHSVSSRNGDSHFNKILPLPPRATPGKGANGENGRVCPRQQNVNNQQTAFQRPTNSEKRLDIAEQRDTIDHSAVARFGMDRFNGATFPKGIRAKTPRGFNHQQVVPTPHATLPALVAVSPFPITPKTATYSATSTNASKMFAKEPSRQFSSDVTNSTRPTIDMGYENNNRSNASQNRDVRRVSLETEHTPMTRTKVMMQYDDSKYQISPEDQTHPEPLERHIQASRRKSFVHDPRRVSMEGPGREFHCGSPMDDAHQAEKLQKPGTKKDSAFDRDVEQTHEHWNASVDMGQQMEGTDEEDMLDPPICNFEWQSQAFLEAHEKTEDLQSEMCTDLHKMSVKFFMDYPELLQQCDELLELLGNCEDLELEADKAIARFDSVISAIIPEDQGEEGTMAMEVEPGEAVIPEAASAGVATNETGSFISTSQPSPAGYDIGSQPSIGQHCM